MKMKSSSPHQGFNSVGVISIRKEVVYLERKGENQVKANSTWEKRKKKNCRREVGKGEGEEAPPLNDYWACPPHVTPPPQGWEATECTCHISKNTNPAGAGALTVKLFYIKKL